MLFPRIRAAFAIPRVRTLLTAALGPQPQLARSILFDKTASANWHVTWHQDLSIAVRQKVETSGFGPWSTKAGVSHVQPPQEILDRMVTLRLHLDTCDATQGVLRVLSGSHRHGRLTDAQIREYAAQLQSGNLLGGSRYSGLDEAAARTRLVRRCPGDASSCAALRVLA